MSCSGLFGKCYTVFYEKVSWDIANRKCRKRSEYLVTIASRMEMNYIQYLLRIELYDVFPAWYRNTKNVLHGAHIGNFSKCDCLSFFFHKHGLSFILSMFLAGFKIAIQNSILMLYNYI
jgi:hypothetical protein